MWTSSLPILIVLTPDHGTESNDARLQSKAATNPPIPGLRHIALLILKLIWVKQALCFRLHPGVDYESYHVDKFSPTMTQRQQNRPRHGLLVQPHDASQETNIVIPSNQRG